MENPAVCKQSLETLGGSDEPQCAGKGEMEGKVVTSSDKKDPVVRTNIE